MLVVSDETTASPAAGPRPPSGRPSRFRPCTLLWLAGFLAASWLVPVGLNALRFDIALPVLILLGTASLLRVGRTVLDRLVLAIGLLFSATCVAGLLFSVWPWHMSPVPVAGASFTVLVLLAWLLRRRPAAPHEFQLADGLVVAAWLCCAAIIMKPFHRGNVIHNLGLSLFGEDFARHFMMYDGSRCLGGYPMMMDPTAVAQCGVQHNMVGYPQGSHLFYALLENFVRSSTVDGDRISELSHLVWYHAFGYVYLCLAVLWAIRWVGGRWLKGWLALPVLGIAAGYLVSSDLLTLMSFGYPSEVAGLALLPLTVALFARPFRYTRTQLLFTGLLTIGIAFTYYLWLPLLAMGWLVWAVQYRRRVFRHLPMVIVMGVLTAGLSLVMPLVNSHYNTASSFLLPGGINKTNRTVLISFLLIVLVAHCLPAVRRLPFFRTPLMQIFAGVLMAAVLYAYQISVVHRTIYYFEKSLHGLVVVQLVSLAALGPLVRRLVPERPAGSSYSARLANTAIFVLLAIFGSFIFLGPRPNQGSRAFNYVRGKTGYFREAYWVVWAARTYPSNDGKFTIIQMSRSAYANAWSTLYLGMMQRNFAITERDYHWLYPRLGEPSTQLSAKRIEENILKYRVPLRIVVINPKMFTELNRFLQQHPDADVELVDGTQQYCPKSTPQPFQLQPDPKASGVNSTPDPRQVGAKCRP